jgi:hypothetical protein
MRPKAFLISNYIRYARGVHAPRAVALGELTQKSIDFDLWVKVVNLMVNKQHLTLNGLHSIIRTTSGGE